MGLIALFVSSVLVNNILLARFLGCCPFLGVSSQLETAKGMGVAVVFVTTFAAIMTWLAYNFILVPLGPEHVQFRTNPGRPRSKAKHIQRPIEKQYREGKVKSTPGGE